MLRWSALALVAGSVLLGPAAADEVPDLAPMAFIRFCDTEPGECARVPPLSASLEVTPVTRAKLEAVNTTVNSRIAPEIVAADIGWRIDPARGDCNDYAVTKRHDLIADGVPPSALRLAAVKTLDGQDHLVLVVEVKDGAHLVLDNLVPEIRPLRATGYRVTKQQSGTDPRLWVEPRDRNHDPKATADLGGDGPGSRAGQPSAMPAEVGRTPQP